MTEYPVLESGQLRLRPITLEDTELIVNWRNRPEVRKCFVFQKPFTAQMHLQWMENKVRTGEVVQYIIEEKESDKPIGSIYFRDIDRENRCAEYGIWIGEATRQGRGYGTEAAKLFCEFGFSGLGLHRIFLRVFAENTRAIQSYLKVGFRQEGTARDCVFRNGCYQDMVFMSMLEGESVQ